MNPRRWGLVAEQSGSWFLTLLLFAIPFSIAAIEILFPLLLLAWAAGWLFNPQKQSLWSLKSARPILLPLALYLILCAASIFYSSDAMLSLRGFTRKLLEYALLFVIAADVIRTPQASRRSLMAWMAAIWGVVLYGLAQEWALATALYKVQALDPIRGELMDFVKMVGPYTTPNDLATFLMVMGLIVAGVLLNKQQLRGRFFYWLTALALAGCLIRTQSMGAVGGFCVGLILLLWLTPRRSARIGAGVAVVLAVGLFIRAEPYPLESLTFSDLASQKRVGIWGTAGRMIKAKPLLGHGLNTFMANYATYSANTRSGPAYAHNCFLQVAAETGVAGLALFLWFLGAVMISCWRSLKRAGAGTVHPPWLAGLVAGLAAFLVQSLFDTNFYALRQAVLFWTLAGCAYGMSRPAASSTP